MSAVSIELSGSWQFSEYPASARKMADLEGIHWLETQVPGSIFTSLIEAGQIKKADIYARPEDFSGVSEKPWIFKKTFEASKELLACGRIDLVFDGLDTVATIWLNEKIIGRTSNMFIAHRFDITGLIRAGENCLMVKFDPAEQYARSLMKRQKAIGESDFFNAHRVFIRKAQFQFGWDFCPALPGCGIWRGVILEGVKKAKLEDVHVRTVDCNPDYADMRIEIGLDIITKGSYTCRLVLSCGEREICRHLTFEDGQKFQSTVVRIERPSLWWPAGYGEQPLYRLDVELLCENELLDRAEKHFAVRTLHLNCSTDEPAGRFEFEINGRRIYVRGADLVPASLFAGSVKNKDYEKLLCMAREANINMLRVWGGGYYEATEFYNICDRLGIMVWQDFMFACGYYPQDGGFLEQVKKEAQYVVKRLRSHPCIVLWCGNNEIDWMHAQGKLGGGRQFCGREIFHKLLAETVRELDADRAYIPTTPLPKKKSFGAGQVLTSHDWDVWSGHQSADKYICPADEVAPFVTEFGFQSVPCLDTLKEICGEGLRVGGRRLEKCNYQVDGNSRLYRYIGDFFGGATNPDEFVYLSQLVQARAAKMYVEHLRSHNHINSGVLFWQFNDVFPAISWSAIDYMKRPKAVYYYARRFFAECLVAVIPEFEENPMSPMRKYKSLAVSVINDTARPLTGQLTCSVIDLFGRGFDRITRPVSVGPFSVSKGLKLPREMVFPEHPEKCCLHLSLENEDKKIAENIFFYLPDKYIDWPKPEIAMARYKVSGCKWKLTLKSDSVAKDVYISSSAKAEFSNNFMDLMPHREVEVEIDIAGPDSGPENVLNLLSINTVKRYCSIVPPP